MSYLKKVEKQREKSREAERRRVRKQEMDSMMIHRAKRSLAKDKALLKGRPLEDESLGCEKNASPT